MFRGLVRNDRPGKKMTGQQKKTPRDFFSTARRYPIKTYSAS